jgi:F0F1-type ATP synthase epsilon subunit
MMQVTITRPDEQKTVLAHSLQLSTAYGRRTILPGHAPALLFIESSHPIILIDTDGKRHEYSHCRGIAQIERSHVQLIIE